MFAVLLVALTYVFLTIRILFYGLRIVNFTVSIALVAVGFLVVPCWAVYHLGKPRRSAARSPQPAPPAAPKPAAAPVMHECTFRVAGVTYDNDDGESRQEILRHLKFEDEPYYDPDDEPMVGLMETSFNNELAIEVAINGYQIGFVPRQKISQVKTALDSYAWTVDKCSIYGGSIDSTGEKHSYGCEITISWAD